MTQTVVGIEASPSVPDINLSAIPTQPDPSRGSQLILVRRPENGISDLSPDMSDEPSAEVRLARLVTLVRDAGGYSHVAIMKSNGEWLLEGTDPALQTGTNDTV